MESVKALTAGLIDYAGLFPPAELEMREAVESYSGYFASPDAASLGKFILPVERIGEFEQSAGDLTAKGKNAAPWPISILVKADLQSAIKQMRAFDSRHGAARAGGAKVTAIEMPFACLPDLSCAEIQNYAAYVEVAASDDVATLLSQLKNAGVNAKLRTGGVVETAFPSTYHVIRFLRTCCDIGIAFKATAGLHHPVRADFPLTYKPDGPRGTMFGFLNVFLAAVFMWSGADDSTAAKILEETDSSSFAFDDSAVSWRDQSLSVNRIAAARHSFAHSFGSCSFREPVDELKLLLAGAAAA
jgi:hypothetical protein